MDELLERLAEIADLERVSMLLAWDQDGTPLARDDGPLRLVVPGDLHGGRYIHGIVSIDVRSIEEGAS